MQGELRFVFEVGNTRVEELDWEGDVAKKLGADWGTIEGFFNIWIKEGVNNIKTIAELEEVATKY